MKAQKVKIKSCQKYKKKEQFFYGKWKEIVLGIERKNRSGGTFLIMEERRKVATLTLGCKVNQYETDAVQELLSAVGYEIVEFHDKADVYLVNTCSVTNMADRKSRQMLHRARKMNPEGVVIAMGCYVQSAAEELLKDPYVDLVIGNNKKKDIVTILDEYFRTNHKVQEVIDINDTEEYEELTINEVSEHTRAYIKVQDGCNQFCSYCIIPYTRGRVRSRKMEDVLKEVESLAKNGYKEVVLTGIHLSSYGIDLREDGEELHRKAVYGIEKSKLLELIQKVAKIEGIKRVRLGSLEPRIITEEFATELTKIDEFCPHFHLSLQSGCDETLKRMNRHYTCEEYKESCNILRKAFDRPALTTDVIVGFPGETEEEFEQTYAYLDEINLYEMHVFKYSRRKGTRADQMKDQIADPIKAKRSALLLAMSSKNQKEFEDSFLGETVEILLEEAYEEEGKKYFVGHTKRYQKVAVEGDSFRENEEVLVTLTGRLSSGMLIGTRIFEEK